ncbi:hypothetical protein Nepgr_027283 [Nepenthes gracilis]|uniref:Uncharacterized protein n=1 Tax=Nepenthes gracilis TaxID=150966 RepID=A0AAD3Y2T5_NEPGR|nr:hypothetical protein Nepgr_027283 [Nepenthes gracilis]
MDVHNADDKSQYMNLGHAASCQTSAFKPEPTTVDHIVPLEMVLHAGLAKEGHADSVLQDNFWQENEQLISSTSLCLAHAVSKEFVMDVKDSINSFAVLQVLEDIVEQEEGAKECKSSRGRGDAGELKEPFSI